MFPRASSNKFNAKKVTVEAVLNGKKATYTCDSQKEAERLVQLSLLNRAGKISNVQVHVPFLLIPAAVRSDGKTERAAKYIADFVYEDQSGKKVVEDVKSSITRKQPEYVLKRKLMLFVYGISVLEV